MEEYGLAELTLELALLRESPKAAVQLFIEHPHAVREGVGAVFGKGDREGAGLDLARQLDLDLDLVHRAAIVSEQRGSACTAVWRMRGLGPRIRPRRVLRCLYEFA